jgi:Trypsin/PEP-CTERM motif
MKLHLVLRSLGGAALLAGLAAPAQAITNGTATTAFAAVGLGVQVTPSWVFTATHVLGGLAPGSTYSNGYGTRTVAAVYSVPGTGDFPNNDLSLVRLVAATTGAPFLPVNGTAVPAGSFAPWDVTITSAANAGPARGYGFSNVSASLVTYSDPTISNATVNWLINTDTHVLVQGGDSGGGLFAGHVTDASVLLGITSALLDDSQNPPTLTGSAFVQPAAYRAWIDATLLSDNADNEAVAWTALAVPEPGTWALWLAGLVGLAGLRGLRVVDAKRRKA